MYYTGLVYVVDFCRFLCRVCVKRFNTVVCRVVDISLVCWERLVGRLFGRRCCSVFCQNISQFVIWVMRFDAVRSCRVTARSLVNLLANVFVTWAPLLVTYPTVSRQVHVIKRFIISYCWALDTVYRGYLWQWALVLALLARADIAWCRRLQPAACSLLSRQTQQAFQVHAVKFGKRPFLWFFKNGCCGWFLCLFKAFSRTGHFIDTCGCYGSLKIVSDSRKTVVLNSANLVVKKCIIAMGLHVHRLWHG